MKKVLLVEDDPVLNKNITEALEADGLEVSSVFDGLLAERLLKKNSFDCLVLDINVPGVNGYEICANFRLHNTQTPVLMLTAFDELDDKVKGFESGADDYLTKPFYMRELTLRIRSLLKRVDPGLIAGKESETLQVGDITVHLKNRQVSRQGKEISLTPREYQILLKLLSSPGELVSKRDLIQEIWGTTFDANTNTIEVYINFLRKKIDKPFGKNSIKTKIGYGYFFEEL